MEGQDSILSVLGPLSNSLSGIKLFMQTVSSYQPWLRDPLARRTPWNAEAYALSEHGGGKELCFAVLWNDQQVLPHPPVIRALEMTKAALIAAGHKG
jgi:amidase